MIAFLFLVGIVMLTLSMNVERQITVAQLHAICKHHSILGYHKLPKDQLMQLAVIL
jgi:hypothetical protein